MISGLATEGRTSGQVITSLTNRFYVRMKDDEPSLLPADESAGEEGHEVCLLRPFQST